MSDDQRLAVVFPGDPERASLYVPLGFKKAITWFLDGLYARTGYKCSRNEFMMKAARFYLDHLLQSEDIKSLLANVKNVAVDVHLSETARPVHDEISDPGPLSENVVSESK